MKKIIADIDNNINNSQKKISDYQLKAMIICNTIGSGIIFLPKIFFGCSIINLFICFGLIFLIIKLINQTSDHFYNFFTKNKKKLGKFILALLYIKILITTAFELNIFAQISKIYILNKTPDWVINLVLILTAFYLVYKGYETQARLSEILIWIIILPLSIVFFVSLSDIFFDYKNIIFDGDLKINLEKIFKSIFVFSQLDYLFLYNFDSLNLNKKHKKNKNITKKISSAFIISFFIITFLVFLIKIKIEFDTSFPIIKLMSVTDVPGGFIQSQDFFVITFIITAFFSLISSGLFFMHKIFCTSGICKNNFQKKYLVISTIFLFFLSLLSNNIVFYFIIFTLGLMFYFILPVLLLILEKIVKNNKKG